MLVLTEVMPDLAGKHKGEVGGWGSGRREGEVGGGGISMACDTGMRLAREARPVAPRRRQACPPQRPRVSPLPEAPQSSKSR